MTFTVEVLLKGKDEVVEEVIERDGAAPAAWTDEDVRDVLRLTLLSFDRVQNPEADERSISFRGFSWIVTPVSKGVIIAIEIPSGAVVAGPFDAEVEVLTQAVNRVIASPGAASTVVH